MSDQPQPFQVNPSPKQKFLGIKHCVDAHRELMQRQDLNLSLEQAERQYAWELCGGHTLLEAQGNNAAMNFYKLQGAHEFVRTLKNLAETPRIIPRSTAGEIDHGSFK
jgi:hypothetical protein